MKEKLKIKLACKLEPIYIAFSTRNAVVAQMNSKIKTYLKLTINIKS